MRALFLGEDSLTGAGRYLAAILTHARIRFDHQPDQAPVSGPLLKRSYDLFILSDYRHANFTRETEKWLLQQVEQGAGLLMIGGWASFRGLVGHYAGSPISRALPVVISRKDDRVQNASGAILGSGPIICGYHRVKARPGTKISVTLRPLRVSGRRVRLGKAEPALVMGRYGKGRTAAFMTDCAPHWAGGLVDWGAKRFEVQLSGGVKVEVGNQYLKFFGQLIRRIGKSR